MSRGPSPCAGKRPGCCYRYAARADGIKLRGGPYNDTNYGFLTFVTRYECLVVVAVGR